LQNDKLGEKKISSIGGSPPILPYGPWEGGDCGEIVGEGAGVHPQDYKKKGVKQTVEGKGGPVDSPSSQDSHKNRGMTGKRKKRKKEIQLESRSSFQEGEGSAGGPRGEVKDKKQKKKDEKKEITIHGLRKEFSDVPREKNRDQPFGEGKMKTREGKSGDICPDRGEWGSRSSKMSEKKEPRGGKTLGTFIPEKSSLREEKYNTRGGGVPDGEKARPPTPKNWKKRGTHQHRSFRAGTTDQFPGRASRYR